MLRKMSISGARRAMVILSEPAANLKRLSQMTQRVHSTFFLTFLLKFPPHPLLDTAKRSRPVVEITRTKRLTRCYTGWHGWDPKKHLSTLLRSHLGHFQVTPECYSPAIFFCYKTFNPWILIRRMPAAQLWYIPSGTAALITTEPSSHSQTTGLVVRALVQDCGRPRCTCRIQSYLS